MQNIVAVSHAILSPLGISSQQCFEQVKQQAGAIKEYQDSSISKESFFASRLSTDVWMMLQARFGGGKQLLSPFEQMCIYVIEEALSKCNIDVRSKDCVLILSSTKGNIEWLGEQSDERISLQHSAKLINDHFGMKTKPIVVSNACISGSLALITAARMIEAGKFKRAIVVGCDRLNSFVFSGFKSFKALAERACKPFDKNRTGINLGEAAAAIVLSNEITDIEEQPLGYLSGGGVTNDANHLSGPSRTGAELSEAINRAMKESGINAADIGMISAHGTATVFNDEMEAKALHLSGMGNVPLHSLKSYVGHTLGAAGIIESIIACMAMNKDLLPASLGFDEAGVSEKINVTNRLQSQSSGYVLKTASGFGGCNAALIWKKY
ncbi:beta-ketoacyl synthase [Taibaiella lutea]|uniref:Beta-ketoacyl synthase n=1 Tax=Taibaiella lutea TaxID=2608001 RepID=A0A5M6CIP8_9BACT|nr:beta-ketoacyl synthase N-terminal-like domain-containing protein [Taibaiella lutea]KAA5534974.1 beta-ketoacyl synthase [Taibaiella lutea]